MESVNFEGTIVSIGETIEFSRNDVLVKGKVCLIEKDAFILDGFRKESFQGIEQLCVKPQIVWEKSKDVLVLNGLIIGISDIVQIHSKRGRHYGDVIFIGNVHIIIEGSEQSVSVPYRDIMNISLVARKDSEEWQEAFNAMCE